MMYFTKVCVICVIAISCLSQFVTSKAVDAKRTLEDATNSDSDSTNIHSKGPSKLSTECSYIKGPWSTCDPDTKLKTRILKLKNDSTVPISGCQTSKTMKKKCKTKNKTCKYTKGTWSDCDSKNEMTRIDKLKTDGKQSNACEKTKNITKKCNQNRGQKKKKDRSHHKDNKNNNNDEN